MQVEGQRAALMNTAGKSSRMKMGHVYTYFVRLTLFLSEKLLLK